MKKVTKQLIQKSLFIYFVLGLLCITGFAKEIGDSINLMPIPEKVTIDLGKFRLNDSFTVANYDNKTVVTNRIQKGIRRMLARLSGRTGLFFTEANYEIRKGAAAGATFVIHCHRPGRLKLKEDESYDLKIGAEGIKLSAQTDIGILRGLETFLQLLKADREGYYFPAVSIKDKPRFPWRGLMIDSCRHFIPVEVIKRNLDGMSAVKMNVLHWHLTEDQGFRVECKSLPKLHKLGSDGFYYTHEQIREIISYAADRGIRVMPEFDIPGHSTSWLVGYPELASAPGPYSIERKYGVMDPTFNPTLKATYNFFNTFFKEMSRLFPDDYIHIGGDENNGKQWDANKQIQAFKKKHKIKDNHALQAYFNKKILKILTKYGKKMVGWDEIFQPDLPKTIVIHSWRGKKALKQAAKKGYYSILSNGYYIDLAKPTDFHYLNDPIPEDSDLSSSEKKLVLGGEATMWSELVSPETVDSRIWPRTAAIAERLWSPVQVKDVLDMYRRLHLINLQLEELGLTHIKNQDMMLRRLTGSRHIDPLKVLVDVIEPVKIYKRHAQGVTYTSFTPLTRVVDAALPDARRARIFGLQVQTLVKSKNTQSEKRLAKLQKIYHLLEKDLKLWRDNHNKLKSLVEKAPVLKEIEPLSETLSHIAKIGLESLHYLLRDEQGPSEWVDESRNILEEAKKPKGHAELMIVDAIGQLFNQCISKKNKSN